MRKGLTTMLAGVLATLAWSATAQPQQHELGLYMSGVRIDGEPISDDVREKLLTTLAEIVSPEGPYDLRTEDGRAQVRQLIADIESGEVKGRVPNALRGLDGHVLMQGLKILLSRETSKQRMVGKIQSWYFQDDGDGRGHGEIVVHMPIANAGKDDFLRWEVRVNSRGYKVVKRVEAARNDTGIDPFPSTVQLPLAIRVPGGNGGDNIWDRMLDHKTYAAGTAIEVLKVSRYVNGTLDAVLDRASHPSYYDSTGSSCIDLLTDGPPPRDETGLPQQPGYCLGRCTHPDIVNSS